MSLTDSDIKELRRSRKRIIFLYIGMFFADVRKVTQKLLRVECEEKLGIISLKKDCISMLREYCESTYHIEKLRVTENEERVKENVSVIDGVMDVTENEKVCLKSCFGL